MADIKKHDLQAELAAFVKAYAQDCVDKTGKNVRVVLDPEFAGKLAGFIKTKIASWVHSFTPYADVPKEKKDGKVAKWGPPEKQMYFEDFLGK